MTARDLALTESREELHTAATNRSRVRIRGVVAERGDGYSGKYRNVWLRISFGGTSVRVTATPSSRLGSMEVGTSIELAGRLTGLVDVADDIYFAEWAKLLPSGPNY